MCKPKRTLAGCCFIIVLCRPLEVVHWEAGNRSERLQTTELCFPTDWKTMTYVIECDFNMLKTNVHVPRCTHANSHAFKSKVSTSTGVDPLRSTE